MVFPPSPCGLLLTTHGSCSCCVLLWSEYLSPVPFHVNRLSVARGTKSDQILRSEVILVVVLMVNIMPSSVLRSTTHETFASVPLADHFPQAEVPCGRVRARMIRALPAWIILPRLPVAKFFRKQHLVRFADLPARLLGMRITTSPLNALSHMDWGLLLPDLGLPHLLDRLRRHLPAPIPMARTRNLGEFLPLVPCRFPDMAVHELLLHLFRA